MDYPVYKGCGQLKFTLQQRFSELSDNEREKIGPK